MKDIINLCNAGATSHVIMPVITLATTGEDGTCNLRVKCMCGYFNLQVTLNNSSYAGNSG